MPSKLRFSRGVSGKLLISRGQEFMALTVGEGKALRDWLEREIEHDESGLEHIREGVKNERE